MLTGQRDEELLREALARKRRWVDERFALPEEAPARTQAYYSNEAEVGAFVHWCVELGELRTAKRYYRQYITKPVSVPPRGRKWVQDFMHVAYLLAVHFPGEQDIGELVRQAMERHYRYMERWMTVVATGYSLAEASLSVAYIRAKYFGGDTDPVALLKQMVRDSL